MYVHDAIAVLFILEKQKGSDSMGGNCLKIAKTRRFEAAEFHPLVREISEIFYDETNINLDVIKSYRNKESFGDADFLVTWDDKDEPIALIQAVFDPVEIVRNGPVTSFDYKELQVDLIHAPTLERVFSRYYYAWNDCGNFIGRTAHRIGFKFGHNGLWYRFYDPEDATHLVKEILVTRDFYDALEFLGFDGSIFEQGFDTPEQIFEFVASSEWFDPRQFLLANRASEGRKRDRTRKMYTKMLEWIMQEHPHLSEDEPPLKTDKAMHLQRAFFMFPDFATDYQKANTELQILKAFKANFNGDNYSKWFGIEGKELGTLMQRHRVYFEKNSLCQWISTLSVPSFKTVALTVEEHELYDK